VNPPRDDGNVPVDDLKGDGVGNSGSESGGTSIVRSLGRKNSTYRKSKFINKRF